MFENMIGLEAEFFVVGKKGGLVYPKHYGFGHDDFIILGEFRAAPGKTRAETVANFFKEYYTVMEIAKKKNVNIILGDGSFQVDPEFHAKVMRKMETKNVATCENIYGTDILSLTDAEIKDGKILHHWLSIGLHVHFSSEVTNTMKWKETKENYYPVNLPLSFGGGGNVGEISVYQKGETKETERSITSSVSRITRPVLKHFIEEMDSKLLTKYAVKKPLKYRNPGFYEIKPYGFEYRSLPFSDDTLKDIYNITDFAFSLLEEL